MLRYSGRSKLGSAMAFLSIAVLAPIAVLGIALAFGGPKAVAPMASINDPFRHVDFTDLPPLSSFIARDGSALGYRRYVRSGLTHAGSVILIHGSSASSASMHSLAKAFAGKGYVVYALDMRGHGASGMKGTISYVGQLEDDLEDFVRATSPEQPSTLAGFSAGGGFVLRVAGSLRQDQFQSCLLLSPFLGQDAPTYRPGSGGWVSVGMARIIAIDSLNRIGIGAFNQLPVTAFALNEKARAFLTPEYSFALMSNFRPHRDYAADIRSAQLPCAVVVGEADEVFHATRFEQAFRAQGKNWPVHMVPRLGHIPLILEPGGLAQAVDAVDELQRIGNGASRSER